MSRAQRFASATLIGLTAAAIIGGIVIAMRSDAVDSWGFPGAPALWAVAFAAVGVLIARAEPRNVIGWLFLGGGMLAALMFLGSSMLSWIESSGTTSETYEATAALLSFLFAPALGAIFAVMVVFPTGRFETTFERVTMVVVAASTVVLYVAATIWAVSMVTAEGRFDLDADPGGAIGAVFAIGFLVWQVGSIMAFASFVLRYRRSTGVERQQLKWLAYGSAILAAAAFASQVLLPVFAGEDLQELSDAVVAAAVLVIPAAIGIGMLRYRWFDIDVVINRTVVYVTVVALLAVVYGVAVFVLRSLLPLEGDLAVVVSTLAVVALFNPVRKRVQEFVDRRFYRSRYDARRVVEQFSTRLQGEFDVDVVTEEWSAVVGQTLQPVAAGVWIRSRNDAGTARE